MNFNNLPSRCGARSLHTKLKLFCILPFGFGIVALMILLLPISEAVIFLGKIVVVLFVPLLSIVSEFLS